MIKRYFTDKNFSRIKNDFGFLVELINKSFGEFDFALRNDYFNIYYKGNSLAKVEPIKEDTYKVTIHKKFFNYTKADNPKYCISINDSTKNYRIAEVSTQQLHAFLQKRHLTELAAKIKKVNYGEEIDFEQSLITDNQNRKDFLFIDRQITDSGLKLKRLDLLALKQIEGNKYQFLVSEVKLGNNSELKDKVAEQLATYVKHISKHFIAYKECYEKHYKQKKELGLFKSPNYNKIEIIEPVEGIVIVGSYSGIAKQYINKLINEHNLKVVHLTNKLPANEL